ncbi:MAG: hypothetical protein ACRD4O_10895 [Bryobacteraceae bacterium]
MFQIDYEPVRADFSGISGKLGFKPAWPNTFVQLHYHTDYSLLDGAFAKPWS